MSIATETKVGILVLAAAAGLGWLSYQSSSISTTSLSNPRVLTSEFDSAAGIRIGTKVRMAGVDVGEVSNIWLSEHGTAMVELAVRDDLKLPANVIAQIASDGLVGNKFVALTTDFKPEGQLTAEKAAIPSKGAAGMDDIVSSFGEIANDLKQVSSSLRSALGGRENAEKISNIVNNLNSVGGRLNDVLNKEIAPGKIKNIVDNVSDFSNGLNGDDVKSLITDLKAAAGSINRILSKNEPLADDLISNLSITAKNMASITTRLESGKGTMGRLLTEDKLLDRLDAAMDNFEQFSDKINNGNGTIAKLVNDDTTVNRLDNALASLGGLGDRVNSFQTIVDFNGYTLLGEDVSKGHFNVILKPRPTRFYVLGVSADGFADEASDPRQSSKAFYQQDFGKSLKFNAQFGQVYEAALWGRDLDVRVGIKDSAFGVGFDTSLPLYNNDLTTSLDVYDFGGEHSGTSNQAPHVDLTMKYPIPYTPLYALGGIDNAINDRYAAPFIGVGFRFADDDLKLLAGKAL